MQILGIDSSTKNLSIGFSQDNTGYFGVNFSKEAAFMVNIISCIDNVLKKAGKSISDVEAFSVNIGPGDFTGTRIGISVAKTLALITEKPVYGIRALDTCAAGILVNSAAKINRLLQKNESVFLLPVLDVKRNEVFFSIYQASLAGEDNSLLNYKFGENTIFISKVSGDHLADSESFSNELDRIFLSEPIIVTVGRKPSVFVSGTGFLNYRHLFKDIRKINYGFYLDNKSAYPNARFLNMCSNFRATREIKSLGLNAVAGKPAPQTEKSVFKGDKNVVPVYVRDFVPFIKKQDI
jgi:tRNA threonylcarbamoyl adenosine modification protein YeaZ